MNNNNNDMMKVSISKVAKITEPIHDEVMALIDRQTADLNNGEKITSVVMLLITMRMLIVEIAGEETIAMIEKELEPKLEVEIEGEK